MQIVSLTEEQRLLREVVRELLTADSGPSAVRRAVETPDGYDRGLWRRAAELGWFGLDVPGELGGAGAGYLETSLLLRELGRFATPGPYLSQTLAVTALAAVPWAPASRRWLAPLLAGEVVGAVVLPRLAEDGRFRYPIRLTATGELVGEVVGVPDAGGADVLVVTATGPTGPCLLAVPADAAGLTTAWTPTHDQTRRLYRLTLRGCPTLAPWRLAEGEAATALVDMLWWRASTGVALDCAGGAEWLVEQAVSYARRREQFGRPIGTFQAVKHLCADAFLTAQTARVAADAAVMELVRGGERRGYWSAVAKFRCADAYAAVAGDALQVHGGIGMTWEFDLHLWLKRATLSQALFGSPQAYRARVARLVTEG